MESAETTPIDVVDVTATQEAADSEDPAVTEDKDEVEAVASDEGKRVKVGQPRTQLIGL